VSSESDYRNVDSVKDPLCQSSCSGDQDWSSGDDIIPPTPDAIQIQIMHISSIKTWRLDLFNKSEFIPAG
jgi:hypothetical protein